MDNRLQKPMVVRSVVQVQAALRAGQKNLDNQHLGVGSPGQVQHILHILRQLELQVPEAILLPEDDPVYLQPVFSYGVRARNDTR